MDNQTLKEQIKAILRAEGGLTARQILNALPSELNLYPSDVEVTLGQLTTSNEVIKHGGRRRQPATYTLA